MFRLTGEGRNPLIGDQHDLRSTGRRVPRERDDILLITPDVENDQHVASPYVEQSVAPHADA